MRIIGALLFTAALTLGLASPAQAARYSVTATSPSVVQLGTTVRIAGTVSPAAGRPKVALQRRYPGQKRWTTIARSRTNSAGAYAFRRATARAGNTYFRVYAPKWRGRSLGVSPTRTVASYRWRSALTLPISSSNAGFTTDYSLLAINGLRRSTGFRTESSSSVMFDLRGHSCPYFRGLFGIDDGGGTGRMTSIALRPSDGEVNGAVYNQVRGQDPFDVLIQLYAQQPAFEITTAPEAGSDATMRQTVLAPEFACFD